MRSWRSSAAYRIAFVNFAAFTLGLAVIGAIVFIAMHVAFMHQLDGQVRDEAQTLLEEYRSDGSAELRDSIAQREAIRSPDRMLYAVFAQDGRRLYGSLNAARPAPGLRDISFDDPHEGRDSARGFAVDLSPTERLVVAADLDWIERIDRTVEIVFGLGFLAASLFGLAGAAALGRYLQRRLQSFSRSAEAIIGGDIRRRMPIGPRNDEFDQLAATLNRMLDRIEGLLENLRQVSSDVAHDLRTPLARLRNRLERGAGEDAHAAVTDAIAQVDDVLAIFAAILRITEVESGETRRRFARVDISALVVELAESYAPAIQDGGRTLLWSLEPEVTVSGDRELIAQAAINLIENAQRHTPEGTIIRLLLSTTGESVCLRVIDNGPGVAPADLGRMAKRFVRLEQSRSTAGSGLGLNLVNAVAKLHGGQLLLESRDGLSATLELPRNRAAAVKEHPAGDERNREG